MPGGGGTSNDLDLAGRGMDFGTVTEVVAESGCVVVERRREENDNVGRERMAEDGTGAEDVVPATFRLESTVEGNRGGPFESANSSRGI